MGALIAKVKNNDQWVLIRDQVEIEVLDNVDLTDSMIYDPNNQVSHQWFRIESLKNTEYFNNLFATSVETGELQTIAADKLDDIKFFAYFSNGKFYIQRMLSGCYIKKASFWTMGNNIQFSNDNKMVTINPISDGIYDVENDVLYFQELNRLYNIFHNIKKEYVQGTSDVVDNFLTNDMIRISGDFSVEKVSLSNRKRIYDVAQTYNAYSAEQRNELKRYIHEYCSEDLEYDDNNNAFNVHDDVELRLLLFGMQMRFYKQPLVCEVQVATSTTGIGNLK